MVAGLGRGRGRYCPRRPIGAMRCTEIAYAGRCDPARRVLRHHLCRRCALPYCRMHPCMHMWECCLRWLPARALRHARGSCTARVLRSLTFTEKPGMHRHVRFCSRCVRFRQCIRSRQRR